MKILLIAISATFAVPAAAQTAPMPQHQDHQQHQQAQPGQPATGHDQHQGHAMGDCCQDRNGNGVMDCCEGMQSGDRRGSTPSGAAAQQAAPAQQGHQNH
jgi:hypothetical protein